MYTGMAVRMAIDLGLHLEPSGDEVAISAEEQRLDCLAFWSVLLMDYALSFGTGRQTTFRIEEITRRFPSEEDIRPHAEQAQARSPFPFAARQMLAYGPLINLLNGPEDPAEVEAEVAQYRAVAVAEYNALPADMQWSASKWVSPSPPLCPVPLLTPSLRRRLVDARPASRSTNSHTNPRSSSTSTCGCTPSSPPPT